MTSEPTTLSISRFKATCLAVLERVRTTGQPVLVTKFGTPIALVVPPAPKQPPESWLGALRGHGRVAADISARPAAGPVPEAR
jgi:prevent-host-death family protein